MSKVIVFDIDGTLVDHNGAQRDGLARLYETLEEAQSVPVDQFVAVWQREADRYWDMYQAGRVTLIQLLPAEIAPACQSSAISAGSSCIR